MKKEVFLYGTLQVFITSAILAGLVNYFLHLNLISSLILGSITSLASTAIVLKLFNETGETNTKYGKNVVGILIFQDIAVIPFLLIIAIFSSKNTNIAPLLYQTAIGAILLLVSMWLISKHLLNKFFKYTIQTESQEIFLGSIFFIVFGASYLAHIFGFSYSLGAFIAGMLIAETQYKHQVEADLIPFRELLLGFFFISVGMQLDFATISNNIITIIIILPLIMIIKFFIISLILHKQRTPNIIKTGIALLGLGEFGLVLSDLSKINNLLDTNTAQTLNAIIILSLIITPILVKNLHPIMNFIKIHLLRIIPINNNNELIKSIQQHIIVVGYGTLGTHIVKELKNRDLKYLIVEGNEAKVECAKKDNQPIILGNATQSNILEYLHIDKARSIFISISNPRKLINVCKAVRTINKNIKIIAKVNNNVDKIMLETEFLHNIYITVDTEETAKIMVEAAKNMLATVD